MRRVAIVGSGFGGSVMACRLAESGRFEVHVLERGRRFGRGEFPRRPDEMRESFWDPDDGFFGQFDFQSFERSSVDVLVASGLGGGSLIYSNVLYRAPERVLDRWPGGITRHVLDPYYDRALTMLEARPYPMDRPDWPYLAATPKSRALTEAVARIGGSRAGHPAMRLEWPHLAVQFGPDPGREVVNAQGVAQTTCVMCGECNVGCNVAAKNTLDLNYLARAEAHGATLRTSTAVREILPQPGGGFMLRLGDPRYRLAPGEDGAGSRLERFDTVILAAGSLGSTRLALGLRGRAPISDHVGTRWSPNGDLLGFAVDTAWPTEPTVGPVITGAVVVEGGSYPDGAAAGVWIEDGGFPAFLAQYLVGRQSGLRLGLRELRGLWGYVSGLIRWRRGESAMGDDLAPLLGPRRRWTSSSLPMLGMGIDVASGRLELVPGSDRRFDRLRVHWQAGDGALHYERTRMAMARVAEALGARLLENPLSGLFRRYVSVHPLGGLPMAETPKHGAVDARSAELFGVPGLHVVDGSIVPSAIGPNPSLTIAALAELYAERMCS